MIIYNNSGRSTILKSGSKIPQQTVSSISALLQGELYESSIHPDLLVL